MSELVAVAHLYSEASITGAFAASLDQLVDRDGPAMLEWPPIRVQSGFDVWKGRNLATEHFRRNSEADWLWMLDDDMGFAPHCLDLLLEAADPDLRPVIGGLCFTQRATGFTELNGQRFEIYPTLYRFGQKPDGTRSFHHWTDGALPKETVVKVDATGAACLLIHRSVIDAFDDWWTPVTIDGELQSEDLSFCLRCAAAIIPVYVHTAAQTTHRKTIWLDRETWEAQQDHASHH